jgi:predicted acetyltransferase
MPDWFVPCTYYYLWEDDTLLGEFRIRHCLTEALRTGAGHIGYGIKPEHRGKGYGTKGLALALDVARKIVPEDEIFLRVLKSNIASFKVICKNDGRIAGEDDTHYLLRVKK